MIRGLKTELVQRPAHEMSAQAGFHTDDTTRHLLESRHQRQPLDLLTQNDLPVSIKSNEVKDVLANIDTNYGDLGWGALTW